MSTQRQYKDYVPDEFEEYWDRISVMMLGDQLRLNHKFKEDGERCSLNKDNCLVIHKYAGGWWWKCFRCDDHGYVPMDNRSPSATIEQFKLVDPPEPESTETIISLPYDSVPMTSSDKDDVPIMAWQWIWKYGVNADLMKEYNVHWSNAYGRIIFPVYQARLDGVKVDEKLVGWCGRCPRTLNKQERFDSKRPKYLTKKAKDVARVHFLSHGTDKEWIVVVEDCISAIKISDCTSIPCVALLNKSISQRLMQKMKEKKVIIWLDYNAKSDAFKAMSKMNMMGITTKIIKTHADPKLLAVNHIQKLISRRLRHVDNAERSPEHDDKDSK